jgi:hypothetical protein
MSQIPAEQAKLDRDIIDELLGIIPEDWNAVTMVVEPRAGLDGGGVSITILNPDIAGAEIEPSAEIRKSADQLAAYFSRAQKTWDRLTYAAAADPSGVWRLNIKAPLPTAN